MNATWWRPVLTVVLFSALPFAVFINSNRADLDPEAATALELLGKHPHLRSPDEDDLGREAVNTLVEQARTHDPEASYRSVIGDPSTIVVSVMGWRPAP